MAAAETVTVALSPHHTQALLQTVPLADKTEINDLLLTALIAGADRVDGSTAARCHPGKPRQASRNPGG